MKASPHPAGAYRLGPLACFHGNSIMWFGAMTEGHLRQKLRVTPVGQM